MGGFGYDDKDDTKIKGNDGTEAGQLIASYGEALDVTDILNDGAVYKALTVGTTAVELKVGASVLPLRRFITMQANDNSIYWGYDSSVTTSNGTRIFKDQFIALPIGAGTTVFLIADGAGKTVRIGELA